MPRFSFCSSANTVRWPGTRRLRRLCAILTSLVTLLLLLSPFPAVAQDEPDSVGAVTIGDGDASLGVVECTAKMLGTDSPLADFKLLIQAEMPDGAIKNATARTDEEGKLNITLMNSPTELRVFAYGDYVIPASWGNIPVSTMDFNAEESPAWEVFVRPLRNVRVTGRISIEGRDDNAQRANVAFAPLDVAQDGSFQVFDSPKSVLTDKEGKYEIELPAGFYQVWSYWADRSTEDWEKYIQVNDQRGLFEDTVIDLKLEKGPTLEGRVIDARTGKGVAASINLYTNQYLRQLRNYTSDGRFADEVIDGKEIFWPVGTFKFQAWMIDPGNFSIVIRPQGSDATIKVIPGLSVDDVIGEELEFELFSEGTREVDLKVTTHEQDLPINGLDVNLNPRTLDAPKHLTESYKSSGMTGDDGAVKFKGLAPGVYEVYGLRGEMFLGEIEITDDNVQHHTVHLEIPFAYGHVKLADGEVCKNLKAFVWITNKAGQEFGPYPSDAFKDNPILQKDGRVFIPLLSHGSTMRVRFAAMADGAEIDDNEWVRIEHFPLVTDEFEVTVDTEKGWKIDLTLKENVDYKRYDPDKEDE